MSRHKRSAFIWAVCATLSLWSTILRAEAYEYSQVTAAFIYQISRFATWPDASPPEALPHLGVCVFGHMDEGLQSAMQGLAKQVSQGRSLQVRHVPDRESLLAQVQARDCQIVFTANGDWRHLKNEDISHLHAHPALLIGLTRHFLKQGGMIALVPQNDRIGIVVNRRTLENSHVKLSSRLLHLANIM